MYRSRIDVKRVYIYIHQSATSRHCRIFVLASICHVCRRAYTVQCAAGTQNSVIRAAIRQPKVTLLAIVGYTPEIRYCAICIRLLLPPKCRTKHEKQCKRLMVYCPGGGANCNQARIKVAVSIAHPSSLRSLHNDREINYCSFFIDLTVNMLFLVLFFRIKH